MFNNNPFVALTGFLPPVALQIYIVLMALAVLLGTLLDMRHKGSATFFTQRRERVMASAPRRLSGGEKAALAVATLAEAAVSGEFCKWPRRLSHLLMMYGFLLYVVTTVVMIFAYPNDAATPAILPTLWTVGASMIVVGGLWFFFFLRVNVAHDGDSPFHLGRADLFVASLVVSAALGLIWHCLQSTAGYGAWTWVVFGSYAFFTTLLFGSVFWSKFAHMFFKPAVAYQRRVEDASGCSDLPQPSAENYIVRS
jgi:hypothetical protein